MMRIANFPEEDPIGNDARRAKAERRLPPNAGCVFCGETEVMVLNQRRVNKHLLENHHVFGQANDSVTTAVLCLNCHAKQSNTQRDVGLFDPEAGRSDLEKLDLAMRSLGVFFEMLADACYVWSKKIRSIVVVLDTNYPGWRSLMGLQ